MEDQLLIELLYGPGTAMQLWERACFRLNNDIVVRGSLEAALSSLTCAGFAIRAPWPPHDSDNYEITKRGEVQAKQRQYELICGAPPRLVFRKTSLIITL